MPTDNYKYWVQDANGCVKKTANVTVNQPTELLASILKKSDINCHSGSDSSFELTASGGTLPYQYAPNETAFQPTPVLTNLSAGSYTLVVRDGNGCRRTVAGELIQPTESFTIKLASQKNLTCFEDKSGRLELAPSGGTAPYRLSIDNQSLRETTVFDGLSAITYTIYGKDAHNCPVSLSNQTLTQPTGIRVILLRKEDVDCEYYERGQVLVGAEGGNGQFTYLWSGSGFAGQAATAASNKTGLFTELIAGNYTVTARDVAGCTKDFPVTVIPKSSRIRFEWDKALPSNCTSADGSISIKNINGGHPPYQYRISTQPTVLTNGTYIFTVADSLCAYNQPIDLSFASSLKARVSISPISCAIPTANLSVDAITGGNGNYTLSLDGANFNHPFC